MKKIAQVLEQPFFGKIVLISFIYFEIFVISLFAFFIMKNKLPNEKFYFLIAILIILIISIYPKEKIAEKIKTILLTSIFVVTGIGNIFITISLFDFLNDKFEIFENIYTLVDNTDLPSKEQFKNFSNFLIIEILSMLLLAYFIYATIALIMNKIFGEKVLYKNAMKFIAVHHSQLINEFTIFLVVFGFLPLAIEMVSLDNILKVAHVKGEDVKDYYNKSILVWFLACIIPYAYLLNNPLNNPKNENVK